MNYEELNKNMKGMNTKTTILFWWKQAGQIANEIHDLESFYKCIDKSIKVTELVKSNKIAELKLMKSNWKYPMYLDFLDNECTSIAGF